MATPLLKDTANIDLKPIPAAAWRRKWQPAPVFLPENCHGQKSLTGYSPRGPKESDRTEQLGTVIMRAAAILLPVRMQRQLWRWQKPRGKSRSPWCHHQPTEPPTQHPYFQPHENITFLLPQIITSHRACTMWSLNHPKWCSFWEIIKIYPVKDFQKSPS